MVGKGEYKRLSVSEEGYHHVPVDPVKPPKVATRSASPSFGIRKCLLYTFLAVTGFFCLAWTGAYLFVRHQVQRFTVPAGSKGITTFASQPVSEADLEVAMDQAKLFYDTLKAGKTPDDLIISQDILNGFIARDDYVNTHVSVHIEENQFLINMSLPVDMLPGGHGRFFVSRVSVGTEAVVGTTETLVTAALTTPYSVPKIDFPTLIKAQMVAHAGTSDDNKPALQLTYGQFFNSVAPEDWLDEHKDLLTCDWDCSHHHQHHGDHHGHHHSGDHHGHHHVRKLHRGHHGHHGHHHEDDWDQDRQDCEQVMAVVRRLSVSIADGQVVVHANEASATGNRRLSTTSEVSFFSKSNLARRLLRAAF